jgi:hypothetical protein
MKPRQRAATPGRSRAASGDGRGDAPGIDPDRRRGRQRHHLGRHADAAQPFHLGAHVVEAKRAQPGDHLAEQPIAEQHAVAGEQPGEDAILGLAGRRHLNRP